MANRINGTERYPFPERILEKVRNTPHGPADECWIWPLYIHDTGYGATSWFDGTRTLNAFIHRVSWVVAHGSIPEGLTVHHKCYVRACWNPAHLALLTLQENCRDNKWRRKTHCPQGHEYDEKNTYVGKKGYRTCRECGRLWIYKKQGVA